LDHYFFTPIENIHNRLFSLFDRRPKERIKGWALAQTFICDVRIFCFSKKYAELGLSQPMTKFEKFHSRTIMERTRDGGFTLEGVTYIPYVKSGRPPQEELVSSDLPTLLPHLFYTDAQQKYSIISAHPKILTLTPIYNGAWVLLGLRLDARGYTGPLVCALAPYPVICGDSFYGTYELPPPIPDNVVEHIFTKIIPAYKQYVRAVLLECLPVREIPLGSDYVNLRHITLMNCGLTQLPHAIANVVGLTELVLRFNSQLLQLPYHFLRYGTHKLRILDLRDTGVRCLWAGMVPADALWHLPESIQINMPWNYYTHAPQYLRDLFLRTSRPVMRAATAILAVQKHLPLHRDTARIIAQFIIQTRESRYGRI
jgi:hypothetical protein